MCDSHQNGTGNGRKPGRSPLPANPSPRAQSLTHSRAMAQRIQTYPRAQRLAGVKLRAQRTPWDSGNADG